MSDPDGYEEKFRRCFRRMAALETAYMRRLLRHNADATTPCPCEECAWLRGLMDERLAERLKTESERMIVSADFAGAARRQMEQLDQDQREAEDAIAAAVARRDGVTRERKALQAALDTYERVRAKQGGAPSGTGSKALPAPKREKAGVSGVTAVIRGRLPDWAAAHDGVITMNEFIEALIEDGTCATRKKAMDILSYVRTSYPQSFERVERGVYRWREVAS